MYVETVLKRSGPAHGLTVRKTKFRHTKSGFGIFAASPISHVQVFKYNHLSLVNLHVSKVPHNKITYGYGVIQVSAKLF